VKQLARLSGVSVRTLHFYDEIGLLKPAFVAANGYRFYEQEQVLMLQQILFYRELEFELKEIQRILTSRRFDKLKALQRHRELLAEKQARTGQLLQTIDKTIDQLSRGKKMKATEMFVGFDPKKQAEHEQYLIDRYGERAREGIAQSKRKVTNWSKADWQKCGSEWDAICQDLTRFLKEGRSSNSAEVQRVVHHHERTG
jgi:MerR family transcriptional regulator, thiopeptide resistance regulator